MGEATNIQGELSEKPQAPQATHTGSPRCGLEGLLPSKSPAKTDAQKEEEDGETGKRVTVIEFRFLPTFLFIFLF